MTSCNWLMCSRKARNSLSNAVMTRALTELIRPLSEASSAVSPQIGYGPVLPERSGRSLPTLWTDKIFNEWFDNLTEQLPELTARLELTRKLTNESIGDIRLRTGPAPYPGEVVPAEYTVPHDRVESIRNSVRPNLRTPESGAPWRYSAALRGWAGSPRSITVPDVSEVLT